MLNIQQRRMVYGSVGMGRKMAVSMELFSLSSQLLRWRDLNPLHLFIITIYLIQLASPFQVTSLFIFIFPFPFPISDLDCPTQCSIPVIQANNLARVPSLPSISSSDPFGMLFISQYIMIIILIDEFSSLRVTRRHLSPSLSQSIHPFLIPTVSSSHTTLHTVPHYPVSSISSIPHDPSVTLSLSTNVLQPLRINPHSSQSVQLSSTNPFRDLCDSHQS